MDEVSGQINNCSSNYH